MSTQLATIVQRLWNDCNVLRDDSVSYGDNVDQRLRQAVLKRVCLRGGWWRRIVLHFSKPAT